MERTLTLSPERVNEKLASKGLTRSWLARRVNRSATHITRVLDGERPLKGELAEKIAIELDLDLDGAS